MNTKNKKDLIIIIIIIIFRTYFTQNTIIAGFDVSLILLKTLFKTHTQPPLTSLIIQKATPQQQQQFKPQPQFASRNPNSTILSFHNFFYHIYIYILMQVGFLLHLLVGISLIPFNIFFFFIYKENNSILKK